MSPAPKPERGAYSIEVYMTKTFKHFIRLECRKRGLSMSALGRLAYWEYFQPKQVITRDNAIERIKRSKKSIILQNEQSGKVFVIKELKESFEGGFKFNSKYSDKEIGLKSIIKIPPKNHNI